MLMNIANLWNELLIGSIGIYIVALLFLGLTYLATETKHLIIGAILALTTGFFVQISEIAFKIGAFLLILRIVLNFI